MAEGEKQAVGPEAGADGRFACDFCGERVARVRRVALDRGYERLQTPHPVRYACERCSEQKERARLGLAR
jgi:hypothetical protein